MTPRARILVADPPWDFTTWSDKAQRSAKIHYSTMDTAALAALPVADCMDDNAILFLWATWPNLIEAIHVGQAWGFTYKTLAFDWVKIGGKTGAPTMGLGYYTRANSEPCLLFTRGKVTREWIKNRGVSQIILDDERQTELPGFEEAVLEPILGHSTKPEAFYTRIQRLVGEDGPFLELFGRRRRKGWTVLGNAIDGKDIRVALQDYTRLLKTYEEP